MTKNSQEKETCIGERKHHNSYADVGTDWFFWHFSSLYTPLNLGMLVFFAGMPASLNRGGRPGLGRYCKTTYLMIKYTLKQVDDFICEFTIGLVSMRVVNKKAGTVRSRKVTFYTSPDEYVCFSQLARRLYEENAIPRPTVASYSRAAALKMYSELAPMLARADQEKLGAR